MRFKTPLRGVHIGSTCVDGTPLGKTKLSNGKRYAVGAHTHFEGEYAGWICAESAETFQSLLTHELAHLKLGPESSHDDRWRNTVRRLGGTVSAAYQKRT